MIERGPKTRIESLRAYRRKIARYALWVAGGLIVVIFIFTRFAG